MLNPQESSSLNLWLAGVRCNSEATSKQWPQLVSDVMLIDIQIEVLASLCVLYICATFSTSWTVEALEVSGGM